MATSRSAPLQKMSLWGGAMTISLPPSFENISEMAQVADTEELLKDFVTKTSITLELLDTDEEDISGHGLLQSGPTMARDKARFEYVANDARPNEDTFLNVSGPAFFASTSPMRKYTMNVDAVPAEAPTYDKPWRRLALGFVRYENGDKVVDILVTVIVVHEKVYDKALDEQINLYVSMVRDSLMGTFEVINDDLLA